MYPVVRGRLSGSLFTLSLPLHRGWPSCWPVTPWTRLLSRRPSSSACHYSCRWSSAIWLRGFIRTTQPRAFGFWASFGYCSLACGYSICPQGPASVFNATQRIDSPGPYSAFLGPVGSLTTTDRLSAPGPLQPWLVIRSAHGSPRRTRSRKQKQR